MSGVATIITDSRQGIAEHLRRELGSTVEVVSGERDGVDRREKDLVAVWWPGWEDVTLQIQRPTILIRYFPARSKLPAQSTPVDPTPLELAAGRILTAFPRATQTVGVFAPNIAWRLRSIVPNTRPDVWRVEAVLVATTVLEGA